MRTAKAAWRCLAAAVALLCLGSVGAQAADCRSKLPAGKEITLSPPMDEPTRLGLATAIYVGLVDTDGGDWPRDVVKEADSCRLGEIEVGGETVALWSSSDGQAPPVWARTAKGRIAFLALSPSIKEAYGLYQKPPKSGSAKLKQKPVFALVVANGTIWRYVERLYDGVPPVDQLEADFAAALKGETSTLAAYHAISRTVSLEQPTQSGRNAVLFGPPPDGRSTAFIVRGDGDYFVEAPEDSMRMTASGLRCPAKFGAFSRMDLLIVNVSEEGRDQACRYIMGGNWFSLFVTRIPDPSFDIAAEIAERAKTAAAGPGVATPLTLPPGFIGQAWRDKQGSGQAIMMARRGPYIVEFRATFLYQDQAEVVAAAGLVAIAASRDIPDARTAASL